MPCQLQLRERAHTGLVIDLSSSGLFIQTNAKANRGERFELSCSTDTGETLALMVEVVRTKVVPPRLLTVAQGGIGVRIVSAPDRYYHFLTELGLAEELARKRGRRVLLEMGRNAGSDSTSEVEEEVEEGPRFRVHVSQTSGPRSRRIEVSAPDVDAARERALAEMGEGWKVLGVEPL